MFPRFRVNEAATSEVATMVPDGSEGDPLVVKPRQACQLLACSMTRLYQLMNDGELENFTDGRSRKITMRSIKRYINKRLAQVGDQHQPNRARLEPVTAASLAARKQYR
jgi:hypothetical protein